jgi:hypothetical protein
LSLILLTILITERGGPENAEELRKLAIEKLEEAEEDIKRERKELTEAIEEEVSVWVVVVGWGSLKPHRRQRLTKH